MLGLRVLAPGYLGLAHILQARGDFSGAFEMYQEVEKVVVGQFLGITLPLVTLLKIPLWIKQGNLEDISLSIQGFQLNLDNGFDVRYLLAGTNLARGHIALGEPAKAASILTRLLQKKEVTNQPEFVIEIRMLLALAYQAQNNLQQAITELTQALAMAEPENYIRTFVDEGAPLAALLLKLLEAQPATPQTQTTLPTIGYISRLLDALGVGKLPLVESTTSALVRSLVDPLTERELEVLQLVAAGLSNQAIADKLVVAPSTVKTHIKNIYGKLEARSRIQAVARAKELNLL
jgi:LuxR family maltose regulon positive regulatory protein